jgi:phosphatidylglycerol:prolipoprotein diacylglycerol transferase
MLTIYPVTRFLLEIIRTDEVAMFGTRFSISQLVSFAILAGVIGLWRYVLSRPRGLAWQESRVQRQEFRAAGGGA